MADIDIAATAAACPLQSVPLEVLLRITYWLKTPDFGSLRATCKSLETMLFNPFAEEFFARKQFMITDFSLQALIDISKSRMGPRIRRLQFGLEQIKRECLFHTSDHVVEMFANQAALWNSGAQVRMMSEALFNLENLQDVVIRDFNSQSRNRDYPDNTWHSYGYTAARDAGADFNLTRRGYATMGTEVFDPAARTFTSLLQALGEAGQRPKALELMFRQGNNLGDASFAIPSFLQPTVVPVLQNLETLHLCVALGRGTMTGEVNENDGAQFLCRFLSYTSKLKNLRINGLRTLNPGMDRLLKHLADPNLPVAGLGHGISLPHLTELSLGMMEIDKALFISVFKTLATSLVSLEFWRVLMVGIIDPEEYAADPKSVKPIWHDFCQELIQIPNLNLRHIMLGCLEDVNRASRPFDRKKLVFHGNGDSSEKLAYTGPDWKRFMQERLPTLKYESPPPTDDEPQDEEMGEGSDEDDNESGSEDDE
jgi:hypothetical protein